MIAILYYTFDVKTCRLTCLKKYTVIKVHLETAVWRTFSCSNTVDVWILSVHSRATCHRHNERCKLTRHSCDSTFFRLATHMSATTTFNV